MLWEHSDSRSTAEINDAPFASLNCFLEAPVFYWFQESMRIHIARSVLWCSFALSSCIKERACPDLHPKLTESAKKNFEKLSKNSFSSFFNCSQNYVNRQNKSSQTEQHKSLKSWHKCLNTGVLFGSARQFLTTVTMAAIKLLISWS